MIERTNDLFHGRSTIGPVRVNEIDIFEIEPLESTVNPLDNVLSRKSLIVDGVVSKSSSPVELYEIS